MNTPISNEHNDRLSATENTPLPSSTSGDYNTQQNHMTLTTKLKLLNDKIKEYEELARIKDLSGQLDQHFFRVGNDMHRFTEGTRGVACVMSNWDYVFETMGLMNTESGLITRNPTIVRLPIVAKSRMTDE